MIMSENIDIFKSEPQRGLVMKQLPTSLAKDDSSDDREMEARGNNLR